MNTCTKKKLTAIKWLTSCVGLLCAFSAHANIVFYDNQSDFLANSTAILRVTFNSFGDIPYSYNDVGSTYVENNVAIHQGPGGGSLVVLGPRPGEMPTSALVAAGEEDFVLAFGGAASHAVGFSTFNNIFGSPVVDVYDQNNQLIASHTLTQAPSTQGFFGITSDQIIGQVRWVALHGESSDTYIDNIYVDNAAAVPEPSTYAMLTLGICCMGIMFRRKSKLSGSRLF